jgi:REP element-mobilizing transposase RayT
MSRPLRIEFPGAFYHVTSRGNERKAIFYSDGDRLIFSDVLEEVCRRFNWIVHAYCQMDNHYHLLVETSDGNLSKGMRQLNGVYTQRFNRKQNRVGHVFQGRYKAILVDKDSYLLELARYIVLNPVMARMVRNAEEWPWSSYRATAGLCEAPVCLQTDWVLGMFSGAGNKKEACERYCQFVAQGKDQPSPWEHLKNQVYLGTDAFVDEMQCKLSPDAKLQDIPAAQTRRVRQSLEHYAKKYSTRNLAIEKAYLNGGYGMKEIGDYFGVHYSRISQILRELENSNSRVCDAGFETT